jgi:hypothetical protein
MMRLVHTEEQRTGRVEPVRLQSENLRSEQFPLV